MQSDDRDLERADAELLCVLENDLATARRRAGAWLACGPGCSACCVGPFPITRLDVRRLQRGLADLRREDATRARRIVARARAAVRTLSDGYPGNPESGRLTGGVDSLDRFFEEHASLPCPALDPDSGRCQMYRARPVSCRTHGPPLRFLGEDFPPCALCFEGAPREAVEGCRIEPDANGLEEAILAAMDTIAGDDWETLIPFALLAAEGEPD